MHSLGVAFVKKGAMTEGLGAPLLPPRHSSSTYEAPRMDVEHVRLEGPFNATGPGDTLSRRQIFVCQPTTSSERSGAGLTGPRKRSEPSGVEGPPRVISEPSGAGLGGPRKRSEP